jgi:hypothetical protein
MPNQRFQTLFDATAELRWERTDAVQERARRRRQRRRAMAVVAAVVTLGLATGGLAAVRLDRAIEPPQRRTSGSVADPSPYGPSSSTPASTQPPKESMSPAPEGMAIGDPLFLQPEDVGRGYRTVEYTENPGDWTFESSSAALGCPPSQPHLPPLTRLDRLMIEGASDAGDGVRQYIAVYRPGDAAHYLDQIRSRVRACRPGAGRSIRIGAQRFAGADALLIEVNGGGGNIARHVLVRRGDVAAEFLITPTRSRAATLELGRTAARRLCAGAPVC